MVWGSWCFWRIWNSVDGDERQVIQGILQVSVSQFHLSKGNLNGATILLGEGLGRIKTRTKINLGIDLESFCQCLEDLLRKLQYKELLNESDKPFLKPLWWIYFYLQLNYYYVFHFFFKKIRKLIDLKENEPKYS